MTPVLLILHGIPPEELARITSAYDVIYAPGAALRKAAIAEHGARIQVVMTIGAVGLTASEIEAMPRLELICALGAGYEGIDLAAARARGIALTNGAGTNDACVADHAMGLLIAAVRGLPRLDATVRQGQWRLGLTPPPSVSGRRLGIVGLGTIGMQIARRASAFDMAVGYHNRRKREDVDHEYFASLAGLAEWCDFLMVTTPGGDETRHLVDERILLALGSRGVVVNVSRGSVVDTAALAHALRSGIIAGAGLDVYESEPAPPTELLDLDNVVLTPHVAGWSPEAIAATVSLFLDNVERHLSGRSLRNPI